MPFLTCRLSQSTDPPNPLRCQLEEEKGAAPAGPQALVEQLRRVQQAYGRAIKAKVSRSSDKGMALRLAQR